MCNGRDGGIHPSSDSRAVEAGSGEDYILSAVTD